MWDLSMNASDIKMAYHKLSVSVRAIERDFQPVAQPTHHISVCPLDLYFFGSSLPIMFFFSTSHCWPVTD